MNSDSHSDLSNDHIAMQIKSEATRIGFDCVGITPAVSPVGFTALQEWLSKGYAGEMSYMERRKDAYQHPRFVMENVKTVIALAVNYKTEPPSEVNPGEARIARYAWGEVDYHDLLRAMLRQLGDFIRELQPGCQVRGTVDTAPILERDFAKQAGLGWFGKNTMLINKSKGSFLFLAAMLVDFELPEDAPHETAHCGTCTRCLDVCPTDAFSEPYVLDARKCLSYLTIELKDKPIPFELREGVGDWLFGCDLCQDVCPWNRKSPVTENKVFQPSDDLHPANAVAILQLSPEQFRKRFRKSPMSRPKRAGILRTAAIVLGNTKSPDFIDVLSQALSDEEPLVRGAAAWALGKIGANTTETNTTKTNAIGVDTIQSVLRSRLKVETEPSVREEITQAITVFS